ncbi:MAG: hypothetical protein ACK5IB_12225 [Qingshengfaniella sp.]
MVRVVLEDFGNLPNRVAIPGGQSDQPGQLESYEKGYAAGWDDATAAATSSNGRIEAGLATSLQDLSFTYQEAYGHVLGAIRPVIQEMVGRLLPRVAQASLPNLIVERLETLLVDAAGAPVTLAVSPADHDRILALLPPDPGFPLTLTEDDTLTEGQVFLKAATLEEEIDTKATLEAIATAVDEFFMLNERQNANG